MRKKWTSAAVLFCFLFLIQCMTVLADGRRVTMEVKSTECSAGEDVTVLAMVIGTEGSASIGFDVRFDAETFEAVSIDYGIAAKDFQVLKEEITDGCVSIGAEADIMSAATGTFAKITFHVSEDASGDYEITLEALPEYCSGATELIVTNGIVQVSGGEKEAVSLTDASGEEVAFTCTVEDKIAKITFEMPEGGILFRMAATEEVEKVLLDNGAVQYLADVNGNISIAIGEDVLSYAP